MKHNVFHSFLVVFLLIIGLIGCLNDSQIDSSQVIVAESPKPERTPTPQFTPTPAPTATPEPSPAIFDIVRSNISIMNPEQVKDYIDGITGKKLENWTGFVKGKPLLDDGYFGVTIELDKEPNDRPDLVLIKIDNQFLEQIEVGQIIRFSGTIAGFSSVEGMLNILSLQEVIIHQ